MRNTANDPVDHSRTTRKHAGETMKNGTNAPGVALVAVAVVALVIGLFSFANGSAMAGSVAVSISALAFVAGGVWLYLAHRRVRQREQEWLADNPHADVLPPAS